MPSFHNRVNTIVLWSDLLILSLSFLIAGVTFNNGHEPSAVIINVVLWIYLLTVWYYTTKTFNLYRASMGKNFSATIFKTFKSIVYQAIFLAVFLFIAKQGVYSRRYMALYIFLLCVLLPLQKLIYKKVLIYFVQNGTGIRRVLIVGAGKVGMDFYNIIKGNEHLGYRVVGFLDDMPKASLNGQHLGSIHQIESLLQSDKNIDEIVVALPNQATEAIGHVLHASRNETLRVSIIPDYFHLVSSNYGLSMVEGMPIITLRREPLEDYNLRLIKRLFDLIFSSLMLIFICSWLYPIIALCIKAGSKGPVFFVQLRTGRNNKVFKCLKFRSMVENKHPLYEQAVRNDSRLTKVGAFLRKTNLDEFPQFMNVFLGEMSVVGPRPHMVRHTELYGKMIDKYLVRHLLKSGITGWAQVNGYRGETRNPDEMQKRVENDVFYLENWSLVFDIKIIVLTVWNMLKGDKKAY
ncbi:MAG: undecaprenyl-phosphate glucose phosphotransferase [Flavobacterium sp.]|nr:undecaprenyl-phosphate glucose phosphotransferase [Pedobacter sp.]